ncbi:pentatricopeptide repeat-containing protein At5g66500, mitochondrial-like isoform X3 [Aristolochia californica]|uniref:pentatricopeptide repeat-containing protein At5g66500, mitochondrial-like isoform X3 n=1 Tax=Aristolochia californica TaxID=171875 RepID=UPI0035E0BDD9
MLSRCGYETLELFELMYKEVIYALDDGLCYSCAEDIVGQMMYPLHCISTRCYKCCVFLCRCLNVRSLSAVIANQSFEESPYQHPATLRSLNSLLSAHVRNGQLLVTWYLFSKIHSIGLLPDSYTFTPTLAACSLLPNPVRGQLVHALLIKTGYESVTILKTTLLDMYSKYNLVAEALLVFQEIPFKDVVAWNALLSCFIRHGLPNDAVSFFQEMRKSGVMYTAFTLCSLLKACCLSRNLLLGKQIHTQNREYEVAFDLSRKMKPNAIALTTILAACSDISDLSKGKEIHCLVIRKGLEADTLLCNALLDMYTKSGKITMAKMVFDQISEKNVVTWTSIIDAYGRHGGGTEALKIFRKMRDDKNGVSPNSVTFLALLSACGHSGLVEEAKECFVSMTEKHAINPSPEHYACVIDLLGRAGKVEEAWDLYNDVKKRNVEPTEAVWAALLNACKLNQDIPRGEFAAKHLFELEPEKPGNYILLSNFYASAGKWELVQELRRMMTEKGMRKERGSSSVVFECGSKKLSFLS